MLQEMDRGGTESRRETTLDQNRGNTKARVARYLTINSMENEPMLLVPLTAAPADFVVLWFACHLLSFFTVGCYSF